MAGYEIFRRFRPSTGLRGCCCTSRLCLRLMVSVIWDRRRFHGLIASRMLANDGGRRYPLARLAMETRRINLCLRSPVTTRGQSRRPHLGRVAAGERL